MLLRSALKLFRAVFEVLVVAAREGKANGGPRLGCSRGRGRGARRRHGGRRRRRGCDRRRRYVDRGRRAGKELLDDFGRVGSLQAGTEEDALPTKREEDVEVTVRRVHVAGRLRGVVGHAETAVAIEA